MDKIYMITSSFAGEIRRDFRGYLDMVSRAGYTGIEMYHCPYDLYSPEELKKIVEEYGLSIISAHIDLEDTERMLEYLPGTGAGYIVCPGVHVSGRDDAYEKAAVFNRLGEAAREHGLKFGYHNHNNDFDRYEDETVIDIFLKETDPELVTFELDAAWAWRAGVDAAAFVNAHKGRFELIHVKETARVLTPEDDMKKLFAGAKRGADGRPVMTPEMKARFEEHQKINCRLGDGIINMPALKKAADAQGVRAYIVEREYAYTGDNFTTLLADREYLSALE